MDSSLKAFAEGYLQGAIACQSNDLSGTDDWVVWDKYDINFVGTAYSGADMSDCDLLAVCYPADWEGQLPDHLYSFIIKGSKQ